MFNTWLECVVFCFAFITSPLPQPGSVMGTPVAPFIPTSMMPMSTSSTTTMPMSTAAVEDIFTSSSTILPTDTILPISSPRAPKYGSGRMNNFAFENRFAELVIPVDLILSLLKGSFGSTRWSEL